MDWDCEQIITDGEPIILPCVFTSKLLAIELITANRQDTWYRAGYLTPIVYIDAIGFTGKPIRLGFGTQLVEIPYTSYKLEFSAVEYLRNTSIKIKQLSQNYLYMSGSSEVQSRAIGNVSPITTVASATSVIIAPENLDRVPGGVIVNTSNKQMWFNCTGTAAARSHPNIPIPAGGNFDIPSGYTGAINAIWLASPSGSAVVHTASYLTDEIVPPPAL